jgi:hypothetical protein
MAETATVTWTRKDLVGLEELSRQEIELILDTAPQFLAVSARESGIKKVPLLQGRLVVNWFFEPSTRTRTSFELAAKRLSADTLTVAASTSSTVKGETLATGPTNTRPRDFWTCSRSGSISARNATTRRRAWRGCASPSSATFPTAA